MADDPRDYYGILGVARNATAEEIKRAYRKLARELHPDVNPDPVASDRFKAVTTAYEVLSDPEKRRIVDLGGDPLSNGGGGGQSAGGYGFGGFEDLLGAFFGGGGGASRGPRNRVQQGADALIKLELTLPEAAFGVHRDITVDTAVLCETCDGEGCAPGTSPVTCHTCSGRGEIQSVQRTMLGQVMTSRACPACNGTGQLIPTPCPTCGTEGRVRARRAVPVDVPAGIEDGMRIRMSGRGQVGPGGGPPGDLYIEIVEIPHETFTRDGLDLHCTVQVPMTAAALGTRITLATLDGEEDVEIRAGTQSAAVQSIRGRGVPRLRSNGRGDLHVHIEVMTPTKIDAEQRRLLEQLAVIRDEQIVIGERSAGLFAKVRGAFR
ncbi:MAG: chaperone protein DnaJ [Pseudonocardiales bacterium]|nr:chaperone protein DnaJ [Jatrophihabitantaceae bacterium]MCW2605047.1 chaperone protein DnaJ [Pseudonocardiales bacterium]